MLSSNLLVTRTVFLHFAFKHQEISLLRKFVSAILLAGTSCSTAIMY